MNKLLLTGVLLTSIFIQTCFTDADFEQYFSTLSFKNLTSAEMQRLQATLREVYQREETEFDEKVLRQKRQDGGFGESEPLSYEEVKLEKEKSYKSNITILQRISRELYLAKDSGGKYILLGREEFLPLQLLNRWTKSTNGCDCEDLLHSKTCACCEDGGCQCSNPKNVCTKCGLEFASCPAGLDLASNMAEVFHYGNERSRVTSIVLLSTGKIVSFYSLDVDERTLKEKQDVEGRKGLNLPNEISLLQFVEFFTYDLDGFHKRRLLFVFDRFGASNLCFEIFVDKSNIEFVKLFEWSQKGSATKVYIAEGRVFVGFLKNDHLYVDEIKIHKDSATVEQGFKIFNGYVTNDWQVFKDGRSLKLLLEGRYSLNLFSFTKGKFVENQVIMSDEVIKKVLVLKVEPLISAIVLFAGNAMKIYIPDTESHYSQKLHFEDDRYNMTTAQGFVLDGSPYLTFETKSGSGSEALRIRAEKNEAAAVSERLLRKFERVKAEYEEHGELLEKIDQKLRKSALEPRETRTKWTITGLASFEQPIIAKKVMGRLSEDALESARQTLKSLLSSVEILETSLTRIDDHLEDVVPKSGTKKLVTGVKHFYGPKTSIEELSVTHANIGDVFKDRSSLDQILHNLVRIDDERQIQGKKTFTGKVQTRDLRTSTFNYEDTSTYVTAEEPQEISGVVYMNGITVHQDVTMRPHALVDGIDLSEEALTLNQDHELGVCSFTSVKAFSGVVIESDIVNEESFGRFTSSLLKSGQDVHLQGPVTFSDLVIKNNLEARHIMGVDSKRLLSEPILKSENSTLKNALFEGPVRCNNLRADIINDESFPADFVIKSSSWVNFGSKSFNKINFLELLVDGYVNKVKTSDIVTKSTVQEVFGIKTFSTGIRVLGNLDVTSNKIDGVDISLLYSKNEENPQKVLVFEEEITVPGLIVQGKVNNMSLENISKDLVYKDEKNTLISGRKIFMEDLQIKEKAEATYINDINLDNFVNVMESNVITGKKVFSDLTVFDNIEINGLIDRTNISYLFENSVYLDRPNQVINGEKYFDDIYADKILITDAINEIPLSNLMTKSTDQVFDTDVIFQNTSFDNLKTVNLIMPNYGQVNDLSLIDLKKRLENEFTLSDELVVKGDVTVKELLTIDRINEMDTEILYDIVRSNKIGQVIPNDVYLNYLEVGGTTTTSRFSSGNATLLKTLFPEFLLLNENNYVDKDINWDTIQVPSIFVKGRVNGIYLNELDSELVYLDDPNTFSIKGPKHFRNGCYIGGNLDSSRINGEDLANNLFSRTTSQFITVNSTFDDLTLETAFIKSFNGMNLNDLRQIEKREPIKINGPVVFDGFVQISSLEVNGRFNGKDIEPLLKDAVRLNDKVYITGEKVFIHPPNFKDVFIGSFNGDPKVNSKSERRNDSIDFLVVNGRIESDQLFINDLVIKNEKSILSPSYLRSNFLLSSEPMPANTKFEKLRIEGNISSSTVNNRRLEETYLTRTTNQTIRSPFLVSHIKTKDVYISGTINNHKLEDISERKNYTVIDGSILTNETIVLKGDVSVLGKIGHTDIKIPDDLVFLNGKNRITGLVTFESPVIASYFDSASRSLNGINLEDFESRLAAYQKLYEQDIFESLNESQPGSYANAMERIYRKECEKVSHMQSRLRESRTKFLHSFELVSHQRFDGQDRIKHQEHFTQILVFQFNSKVWMINSLHYGSCVTKVLEWNELLREFEELFTLADVGDIRKWILLESDPEKVLLLGVSGGSESCGSKGSSVWEVSASTMKPTKVEEVEAAEAAVTGSHDGDTFLFLYTQSKNFLYFISNNNSISKNVLKENMALPRIMKQFVRSNGEVLKFVAYDNGQMGIIENSTESKIFMPNVDKILILEHEGNLLVIIGVTKFFYEDVSAAQEFYIYENRSLIPVTSIPSTSNGVVMALNVPEGFSYAPLVFGFRSRWPVVYELGGTPFLELWQEFPVEMMGRRWASEFMDSNNEYYLIWGDESNAYVTRLRYEGEKYSGSPVDCPKDPRNFD